MSGPARVRAVLAADGPDRLILRAAVVVLGGGATTVAVIAGGTARPTGQALLLLLTVAAALVPDSLLPAALTTGVVLFWGATVPRPTGPEDLLLPGVAALLLLGLQLAAAALGVWPPGARVPPSARRRWMRHGLAIAAGTVAVTGFAAALMAARLPGDAVASIAALVAVAGGGIAAYRLITR